MKKAKSKPKAKSKQNTKTSNVPAVTNVSSLLKELTGPSKEASRLAMRTLIALGSPIRDVIAAPGVVIVDGVLCIREVVALIDEMGPSDPKVYTGLATAINGGDRRVRHAAILICREIASPPSKVLKALVTALVSDWRDEIRWDAAHALGKIRSSDPIVLQGLAIALQEYEPSVLHEVMLTIDLIGVPSPELLAGLCQFLYRPNGLFCDMALYSLERFGTFDPALIAALQHLANSIFSFPLERPAGFGEDAEYYDRSHAHAREQHKHNRDRAGKLLSTIPTGTIVPHVTVVRIPQHPIRDEDDERILGLFRGINLDENLTALQVFWCIGCVDREAMRSAAPAMGVNKLASMREVLKPNFKHYELPWNGEYFTEKLFAKLDPLFKRDPFDSHAWWGGNCSLDLREEFERKRKGNTQGKGRDEARWTLKAWKAWKYINQFLTIKGLLPQLEDDVGDDFD